MPPLVPTVSALLLVVVAIQIAAGRKVPWLPASILLRSISDENGSVLVGAFASSSFIYAVIITLRSFI